MADSARTILQNEITSRVYENRGVVAEGALWMVPSPSMTEMTIFGLAIQDGVCEKGLFVSRTNEKHTQGLKPALILSLLRQG
jgi:hypothetical protein